MPEQPQPFHYRHDGRWVALDPRCTALLFELLGTERHLALAAEVRHLKFPLFLVAATGIGKTVLMPELVLYRALHLNKVQIAQQGEPGPRVWVVEPKVLIAQSLEQEMNSNWKRLLPKMGGVQEPFPLFGCKTKVDHTNLDAPIMFITTGIFSIYARKGMFRPGKDFILIDEAHVTLETDEAFELGVGVCRSRGIEINYMSATVDASDIPKRLNANVVEIGTQRFPIWRHNLGQPLDDIVCDLVEQTLVEPDSDSEYFPDAGKGEWSGVRKAALEKGRAKGMLIVVNSYSSEDSDAKRIERLLKQTPFANRLAIRTLAGEVLRDPVRRKQYEADLARWKHEKMRYVLIATSVVEMGVTLPDLDFVVTMDTAYTETENGVRLGLLGTNALIQRIGRVGRERPGIAYVSRERGAPYTVLDDEEFNSPDALTPEPIRWPFEHGDLDWLAYWSLNQKWDPKKLIDGIQALKLPSNILGSEPIQQLAYLRKEFRDTGLARSDSLTEKGRGIEGWIGYCLLNQLPLLRNDLTAYDTWAFFQRIVANAIYQEMVSQIDEDTEDSSKYERFAQLLPTLFLGADQKQGISWRAASSYWYRLHEVMLAIGLGRRCTSAILKRALRMLAAAKEHILREFKADKSQQAQAWQRTFWAELDGYVQTIEILLTL